MLKNVVFTLFLMLLMVFGNHNVLSVKNELALFFSLSEVTGGSLTVYTNTGKGYSQSESETQAIGQYSNQVVKFTLPNHFESLRIDPDVNSEFFKIDWIRVGYMRNPFSTRLTFEQLKPANQIEKLVPLNGEGWQIQFSPKHNDPYLFLTIEESIWEQTKHSSSRIKFMLYAIEFILLLGMFGALSFHTLRKKSHG